MRRFMKFILIPALLLSFSAFAQDEAFDSYETDREPTSITPSAKRNYPGGVDEEDLRVQNTLAEAPLKTDARSIQKDVFKTLYNQELKDERTDIVEE